MRELLNEGSSKWLVLAGTIIALEVIGEESLTHAWQRGSENRLVKGLEVGALVVTCAHLLDKIPHQYDPYYALAQGVDFVRNKIHN